MYLQLRTFWWFCVVVVAVAVFGCFTGRWIGRRRRGFFRFLLFLVFRFYSGCASLGLFSSLSLRISRVCRRRNGGWSRWRWRSKRRGCVGCVGGFARTGVRSRVIWRRRTGRSRRWGAERATCLVINGSTILYITFETSQENVRKSVNFNIYNLGVRLQKVSFSDERYKKKDKHVLLINRVFLLRWSWIILS